MYLSEAGFTKKKAIRLAIILAVAFVAVVVAVFVTHRTMIKKENERVVKAVELANESYTNLVSYKQANSEDFKESDLFGYTIIVDFGSGYKDYLFMVEKTGEVEYKAKVNYSFEDTTITNKDKSEYKLLAPNGKRERLIKYSVVNAENYNVENTYILYGNSKMGFYYKNEFNVEEPTYFGGGTNEDVVEYDDVDNGDVNNGSEMGE